MTKCLKCGGPLPAQGECERCQARTQEPAPAAGVMDRELNLNAAPAPRRIPSFTELSASFRPPEIAPVVVPVATPPRNEAIGNELASVTPPPLPSARSQEIASAPVAAPSLLPEVEAAPEPQPVSREPAAIEPTELVERPSGPTAVGVTAIHARPAAFWRRLLAWLVDGGAVVGVFALYLYVAAAVAGIHLRSSSAGGVDGLVHTLHGLEPVMLPGLAVVLFLAVLYASLCGFLGGRTLGYWLVGIRVVDRRGLSPTPPRAVTRAVLACVSFVLCFAGFWLALVDRRRQTLHDKLTRTFVVRLVKG